ncbi:MAG: DNA replication/repair protein RecF [Oscillospiraceae bacterium]|nr:DNA replication/repair protein RecF [Oscillospiraceae bacterium]
MLHRLTLANFRNYAALDAEFAPRLTIVSGANGQGKTNLLEACYLAATGRSHRGSRDREMIRFGESDAVLRAEIEFDNREITHELRLSNTGRRVNIRNGSKLRRADAFAETLSAVMFTPDDLNLVRGGADERRRLLDRCISQLRPRYAEALAEHTRLYAHKTRVLRGWRENSGLLDALPEFNNALIDADARLIFYRASFVRKLAERARVLHADCSHGTEELALTYKTVRGADTENPDRAVIAHALRERSRELYDAELASGQCLVGARRDDIEIAINGTEARKYASQGQARTAALAVKLAEREIMADELGRAPLLLLDDVLSELDEARREFVLTRSSGGQVVISTCVLGETPPNTRIIEIQNGGIARCIIT